ncbi:MAG: hypothetical protein H0T78_06145, partial [Longispora sp.]|nr:hypothetical protein [Longispora sp. (in: high G+C Gram-positive bacteria)]
WEKANGRKMTSPELANLERGCIGVSVVNIEGDYPNPPLALSFATFEQSLQVRNAILKLLKKNPTRQQFLMAVSEHKDLKNLKNVADAIYGLDLREVKPVIFSQRFFMGGNNGGEKMYRPNPKTGQIDMGAYQYEAKPKYVNFDFGWWDERTNNWWHANHMEYSDPDQAAEDPMYVYQSTLDHYSRRLLDFDNQVFSVTFGARSPKELSTGEIDGNAGDSNTPVTVINNGSDTQFNNGSNVPFNNNGSNADTEIINDHHRIERGENGHEHHHHGFRYRVGGAFRHFFGR